MHEIELAPHAPTLVSSMRAIGYSLESAMADIVDNSIAAHARNIEIRASPYDDPYVAIIDDGDGMSSDELTDAMRHGSKGPDELREIRDLGRFGLGLKTASLSQCRQLTVISIKNGKLSGRRWDIDVLHQTQKWTLQCLDDNEITSLPAYDILNRNPHGTMVLWRELDRLAEGEGSIESGLTAGMNRVMDHLALVFHRYLSQEVPEESVGIVVNNNSLVGADPFLAHHRATQKLPDEKLWIDGNLVLVQPYILPHASRLSPEELFAAGGEEGLRRLQGFYIYRNRRLIVWGKWFGLARQEELTKLARVQVDIPNSLDSLWTLDIKKSDAYPPADVRKNLRRVIDKISETSRTVYRYRGRRSNADRYIHAWQRIEAREGVCYRINREHPLIEAFRDHLDPGAQNLFEAVLKSTEESFPAEALYVDMGQDTQRVVQRPEHSESELYELAASLLGALSTAEMKSSLLDKLHLLEPFSFQPDLAKKIAERVADAR